MKKTTLLLNILLFPFLFSACALYNPFVPGYGQDVIYEDSQYSPAQPIKTNAMYRATMKPYTVSGVKYFPIIPKIGEVFKGIASWYGPNFHGNQTSNGEYYDMHAATAAHKTLPINTLLQVTNLDNGLTTIVRVNDRGPFVKNRIIDLSHQAALDIGMIKKGTAHVSIEVLDFDHSASSYQHKNSNSQKEKITPISNSDDTTTTKNAVTYRVQILSTQNREKAKEVVQKYAILDGKYKAVLKTKTFWQRTYYKVVIGDFKSADEAQNFIADHYFHDAFVLKD